MFLSLSPPICSWEIQLFMSLHLHTYQRPLKHGKNFRRISTSISITTQPLETYSILSLLCLLVVPINVNWHGPCLQVHNGLVFAVLDWILVSMCKLWTWRTLVVEENDRSSFLTLLLVPLPLCISHWKMSDEYVLVSYSKLRFSYMQLH